MQLFGHLTEIDDGGSWSNGMFHRLWGAVWYGARGLAFKRMTAEFEFSCHHILAMTPWASYITSLGLNVFLFRKRQIIPILQGIVEDQQEFVNHLAQLSLR